MKHDSNDSHTSLEDLWTHCIMHETVVAAAQALHPESALSEVVQILEALTTRGAPLGEIRLKEFVAHTGSDLASRRRPTKRKVVVAAHSDPESTKRTSVGPRCEELVLRKIAGTDDGQTCAELTAMLRLNGELVEHEELAIYLRTLEASGVLEQAADSSAWKARAPTQAAATTG